MSGDENSEGSDPTSCDAHGFDCSHSLSVKVEYYRSFEYSLKWTQPMSPRRSSRLKCAQKSPESDKEACDIIDLIISGDLDVERGTAREAVGTLSYGLDRSNDESGSESSSSIVSGPSTLCHDRRDYGLCSACQNLYEKAKRLKTPVKSKLLDNDPESLTCDQWVLMKKWKPRRLPDARRKLLSRVRLDEGIAERRRGGQSSPCSRPHTFLQRNLRRASSSAEGKKKNRRKRRRRRGSSQGSRVAKQQRLPNNRPHQHTHIKGLVGNPDGCLGSNLRDRRSPETESGAEKDQSFERVPSSGGQKAVIPSAQVQAQRSAPKKKTCEFRDLLAQLRGNSSMIIRETC